MTKTKPRTRGIRTKDIVVDIVRRADQPLVSREIKDLAAQRGVSLDRAYITTIMHELVKDGLVSSRPETADERAIRTSDNRGAHLTSLYFWAPAGKVPFRTKPMQTVTAASVKPKSSVKKSTVKKPASTDIGMLVKTLTTGQNLMLLQRVAELEKQLDDIRKLANL
jgi:hypothetical protein